MALACAGLLALCGCGGGHATTQSPAAASDPHVSEPFSAQQKLVARGAQLIISEGCSACHLIGGGARAPGFDTFAGHRVMLSDGRRVLVDEQFLRNGLLRPRSAEIRGYDPQPMIRALNGLALASHPQRVAALAAFIEEIGPEPG